MRHDESMVVGIDLVNEEDFHAPLSDFLELIFSARLTAEAEFNRTLDVYLHCGESNSRENQ